MQITRLSLYYLMTYLTVTGACLMSIPAATLRFLGAARTYDDAMPRFVGILMLALGLLVSQIIRLRLEQLYPITLVIRLIIWSYVAWLFMYTREPFFIAVLGVLGLGILLTASAYLADRLKGRKPV